MDVVKIGVIQLESRVNGYQSNIDRAFDMIDQCASQACNLICLPEAFSTAVDLPKIKNTAEEIPGNTYNLLCRKAEEHKIYIIAGLLEKKNDKVYSSAVFIGPEGELIGMYRKAHVYQLEKHFMSAGNQVNIYDTPIGKIGIIIGYDVNFPEICRVLFKQKVEIIVCPAQIPSTYSNPTQQLAIARATENSCVFVLASACGENTLARLKYMGGSMIVRSSIGLESFGTSFVKQNEIIAKADIGETIIYGTLNMKKLRRELEENPQYSD
jgi:predicted amidohydrolase